MADLSTTAATNSPAGSESPSAGDDFIRAYGSIIRFTQAVGANIASANTTDLNTATGQYVNITGTTTITALGTVAAGVRRTLVFSGILTLTHNGTSLILPSSANITTAAGDVAEFVSLGSGNWKCAGYTKVDGTPISLTSAPVTLASASTVNIGAAASNVINITGTVTITAFDTIAAGAIRYVKFTGALTLTYNAASMLLPSAASIVTSANDEAIFESLGSGNWKCISYTRYDGSYLGLITSTVRLNTANGYGSTNTAIRRFTTVVTNQGTDITYADSATNGATFTINKTGMYAISYNDQFNSASQVGISLNSNQLTTGISAITTSAILSISTTSGANLSNYCGTAVYLVAGDVIRAHTAAVPTGTSTTQCQFTITRVS